MAQVSRAVHTRSPSSSVMTISYQAIALPSRNGVATPVTMPELTPLWWDALISTPTAMLPSRRAACMAAPTEPSVSASTHEAPPCSSPYGWVLVSTGMVPTTRSGSASVMVMPIRTGSVPSQTTEGSVFGMDVAMAWTLPVGTLTASDDVTSAQRDHAIYHV